MIYTPLSLLFRRALRLDQRRDLPHRHQIFAMIYTPPSLLFRRALRLDQRRDLPHRHQMIEL
jgi:hypothetical protein